MGLLKTNYKNDVLDLTVNTDRKFNPVDNGDGSFSYVDVTTYQQVGDPFGMDDINTTNNAVNELMGDFASIESTSSASKAYAVGEYLVYNNKLYKVTAAISSGNALNVGGNIELTTVGAEFASLNTDLADTNWTAVTSEYVDFSYKKKNGIVFVNYYGNLKNAITKGMPGVVIGTLPDGFMPQNNVVTAVIRNNAQNYGLCYINANGVVTLRLNNDAVAGETLMFYVCF